MSWNKNKKLISPFNLNRPKSIPELIDYHIRLLRYVGKNSQNRDEFSYMTKLNWIKEHEEVFYDVAFISKILNHIQQAQIDDIKQLFFLLFVSGVVYKILVDLIGGPGRLLYKHWRI